MNIEESIKILDKFTTEHKLFNIKHSDGLEEAIETLLTAYEKEKEEHKKECHNCDEYTARLGELETKNRMLKSELEKEKEKNRQSKMRIVQLENEITARIEDVNQYYTPNDKIKREKELTKIIKNLENRLNQGITKIPDYDITADLDAYLKLLDYKKGE